MFSAGLVQRHLATTQCAGNFGVLQPPGSSHSSSPSIEVNELMPLSQEYWIYEGDCCRGVSKAISISADRNKVSDTLDFVKQLLNPLALPATQEPCDLCGEVFDVDGIELSQHLGEHSVDFCDKRHWCEDCQILGSELPLLHALIDL